MNLKKTLLALPLLFVAAFSQAEIVTATQTQVFSGNAGSASTGAGNSPFVFNKFDASLGTLLKVYLRHDFAISGGQIGADNVTNQVVSGTAELGATGTLDISSLTPYLSLSPFTLSQYAEFTLAADQAQTVGGNGPDTFSMNGSYQYDESGWIELNNPFLTDAFLGDSDDTFAVNYRTYSITDLVADGGIQRLFMPVTTFLNMQVYYVYESFTTPTDPVDPVDPGMNDVPAPLAGFAGLALLGLAAWRRRKQ